MRLSMYTPNFTLEEVNRCWLRPDDACHLSGIGDSETTDTKRFLNNISDRGLIPFIKSGNAKTAPRLYSVRSCVMMRAMREVTDAGCSYDYAASIGEVAGQCFEQIVNETARAQDISEYDWLLRYETLDKSAATNFEIIREGNLSGGRLITNVNVGVLAMGTIAFNVLHRYPDIWSRDRLERGMDSPSTWYDGSDANGQPLDPNHPWNRDLPPLERARRLVEIEEYIAEQKARYQKDDSDG